MARTSPWSSMVTKSTITVSSAAVAVISSAATMRGTGAAPPPAAAPSGTTSAALNAHFSTCSTRTMPSATSRAIVRLTRWLLLRQTSSAVRKMTSAAHSVSAAAPASTCSTLLWPL
jgi:hypothetical protein